MLRRLKDISKYILGSINFNKIKIDKKKQNLIVKSILSNGYFIVEDYMKQSDCEKVMKEIDIFISKYPDFTYQDNENSDQRIFGAEYVSNSIKLFYNDKKNLNICEDFLGDESQCLMTMGNKVTFQSTNFGSGGGWHRDSLYKQFKAILYLNNVSDTNGPFEFIKNSNNFIFYLKTLKILKNKNLFDTRFSDDEIMMLKENYNLQVEKIKKKQGTLILVDTSNLHRGSPLQNGERYALTNYYYPKKSINNYINHFKPRLNRSLFEHNV